MHTLGDLLDVTRGMSLPGTNYATSGELIRLTLGNFDYSGNGFKEITSKDNIYYSGAGPEEFIMKAGDIITPLTEQTPGLLGTTARIPVSGKYIQSQDVALISCKPGKLDPLFCYYLVSSSIVKQQLAAGSQQTKIRHTSPDKIKACVVFIPEDLTVQHRIGEVLTAIDDKIALNRKANTELEALAKQIYDYWFVQFDFPDANGRPYKTNGGKMVSESTFNFPTPDGWDVLKLGDLIEKPESGKRPSGGINKSLKDGIPSLGAECIQALGEFDFSRTPFIPQDSKITSGIIQDNDILVYKDGAYVGQTTLFRDGFPFEYATINEHVFLLRSKDKDFQEYLFYTLLREQYYESMQRLGKAKAAQPGLNQDDLKSLDVLVPPKALYQSFSKEVRDIHKRIFNNALQNKHLIELRDYLLPIFMTGQLSIS